MSSWAAVMIVEERAEEFVAHLRTIREVLGQRPGPSDVLVVANGVGPYVLSALEPERGRLAGVKVVALSQRVPLSVCLKAALAETGAEVLLLCGSYQKLSRDALVGMLDALDPEVDMLVARRESRVDPFLNQLQSRAFNALVRRLTRTPFHDLNCNVRVVRRPVVEEVDVYGDMYRFLPILAVERGFRVKEVACDHFRELGKTGFFGLQEYAGRLVDLVVLCFRTGHARKPLRFFGAKGALFSAVGALILLWIGLGRFAGDTPLGNSPWLLLGLFFLLLGAQVAAIGLVGEILAFTHGRHKKAYVIGKII